MSAHNWRWRWLANPWLRRPFLVFYLPLAAILYAIVGAGESLVEFISDARSTW